MRTTQEILAYLDEQIWYTKEMMKDKGINLPLLAKIVIEPNQDILEQKYWAYESLKWFIEGDI